MSVEGAHLLLRKLTVEVGIEFAFQESQAMVNPFALNCCILRNSRQMVAQCVSGAR